MSERRHVEVVAAVIISDHKVFCAQRGYGQFAGGWEFPGGKIEPGEKMEDAIKREIREEMGGNITTLGLLKTIEHDYPDFHLTMHCMLAKFNDDNYSALEHKAFRWVDKSEIDNVDWLPADLKVIDTIKTLL